MKSSNIISNIQDLDFIESLLAKQESPSLEFKRDFHIFDAPKDSDSEKSQENSKKNYLRDELTHDILALANGNTTSAGETAYLICGAEDKLDENGERPTPGIDEFAQSDLKEIIKIVNARCEPALPDLDCQFIHYKGKCLLVIAIPPTQFLHETNRSLMDDRYSKCTVFIRHGEHIDIATAKEREEILRAKRDYFNRQAVRPSIIGIVVGGYLLGTIGASLIRSNSNGSILLGFIGFVIFGALGGLAGSEMAKWATDVAGLKNILIDSDHVKKWTSITTICIMLFLIVYGIVASITGITWPFLNLNK